jgi:hypothetical protein
MHDGMLTINLGPGILGGIVLSVDIGIIAPSYNVCFLRRYCRPYITVKFA